MMSHEQKKHLARKMLTRAERKRGTPIFLGMAWGSRRAWRTGEAQRYQEAVRGKKFSVHQKDKPLPFWKRWWSAFKAVFRRKPKQGFVSGSGGAMTFTGSRGTAL